jgi:hypothetical protein
MEDWVGRWVDEVLEYWGVIAPHKSQMKQPLFQRTAVFIKSRPSFHNIFLALVQRDCQSNADVFQRAESRWGGSLCE